MEKQEHKVPKEKSEKLQNNVKTFLKLISFPFPFKSFFDFYIPLLQI